MFFHLIPYVILLFRTLGKKDFFKPICAYFYKGLSGSIYENKWSFYDKCNPPISCSHMFDLLVLKRALDSILRIVSFIASIPSQMTDYAKKTIQELKKLCKERSIIASHKKKGDLVAALEDYDKEHQFVQPDHSLPPSDQSDSQAVFTADYDMVNSVVNHQQTFHRDKLNQLPNEFQSNHHLINFDTRSDEKIEKTIQSTVEAIEPQTHASVDPMQQVMIDSNTKPTQPANFHFFKSPVDVTASIKGVINLDVDTKEYHTEHPDQTSKNFHIKFKKTLDYSKLNLASTYSRRSRFGSSLSYRNKSDQQKIDERRKRFGVDQQKN